MTPDVTLFLRTYSGDAHWVVELMRSFDRWAKIGVPGGFRELVVHVDPPDFLPISRIIGHRGRVVASDPWNSSGYINQQIVKLHCDLWVKSPYTLFVDADYLAISECTPDNFFLDGRPHILITPYSVLGASVPWRETVERILKEPVEFETMRGPRLCHVTELFPALRNHLARLHNTKDVGRFLGSFPQLSEFNLAGAFALKVAADRYRFADTTKEPLPSNPFIQFYSKAGITPEARLRIEHTLT